jgi:hypothetical protein
MLPWGRNQTSAHWQAREVSLEADGDQSFHSADSKVRDNTDGDEGDDGGDTAHEKNGMIGMKAPTAVDQRFSCWWNRRAGLDVAIRRMRFAVPPASFPSTRRWIRGR